MVKYPGWRFEAPFAHVATVAVGECGSLRTGDVLGEARGAIGGGPYNIK